MAMKGKSMEVRAGIVVVAALLILALGMFLVSGGPNQFKDKRFLTVYFRNAGGLGNGNAVYLAGRRVGKVVEVSTSELVRKGKTRTFVSIKVEILKNSIVHTDSTFIVSKTVTGIVALNIEYGVGDEATETTELFGVKSATFEEALVFLESENLHGRGLGWIDVQLLASARLSGCPLWTLDRRLAKAALELGVDYSKP